MHLKGSDQENRMWGHKERIEKKDSLLSLQKYHFSNPVVKDNIDQLKANELKDAQNEKEVEATLKNTLLVAFKYGLDGPTFEWIRTMKVRCASMLLDIDSIERKLKGIA